MGTGSLKKLGVKAEGGQVAAAVKNPKYHRLRFDMAQCHRHAPARHFGNPKSSPGTGGGVRHYPPTELTLRRYKTYGAQYETNDNCGCSRSGCFGRSLHSVLRRTYRASPSAGYIQWR